MVNKTKFHLPFRDAWLVFWGGDSEKLNYHRPYSLQKYAFDFVVVNKDNKPYEGEGRQNEDYFAFGKDILCPADGEIIEIVDGLRDNKIGIANAYSAIGNYVLIKHSDHEYSFLAHLRQGSVVVKPGEKVITGQKLGECGNSGNSPEPHLHYHLQDSDEYNYTNSGLQLPLELKPKALGIKVSFHDVSILKGNQKIKKILYSPKKDDIVVSE